jgi:hypothetical protein
MESHEQVGQQPANKIDAVMNAILANDSASLRNEKQQLHLELKESVSNGNGQEVVRIQTLLNGYDLRIKAAEISETKKALTEVENSFAEIETDTAALQLLLKEKIDALLPLLDAYDAAKTEAQQVEFALSLAADRKKAAIETRRELKAKLSGFLQEIDKYEFE